MTIHYGTKKEAHKKLYSRVLAKNTLEGLERSTLRMFEELNYFRDQIEDEIESNYYNWLIDSTLANIRTREEVERVVDKMADEVPASLQDAHYYSIDKEERRKQKIVN